jgi:predicted metal-dependent peptidase
VRVVECDAAVTQDVVVEPAELRSFRIAGYGGSDMGPALERLADDATVDAVVVLTDGDVAVPRDAPPFAVLWVLTYDNRGFKPGYGQVIRFDPNEPR